VATPGTTIDPIYQFEIKAIVPIHVFGLDLSFTNSALFMVFIVAGIWFLMVWGTRNRELVPGRMQALSEVFYEFVASTVRGSAGHEGMRFFPFVFSLFMFILFANLMGLIPYSYTVTSQLAVTGAFAALVMTVLLGYGFFRHGAKFLRLFVPSGVHPALLWFVVLIEVISFLSRPVTLSIRLFANMMAGHITLKVFGAFVTMLLGAGAYAALAPLPLLGVMAILGFEVLVGVLQAYVFTILTCVYLNDAIHPGH